MSDQVLIRVLAHSLSMGLWEQASPPHVPDPLSHGAGIIYTRSHPRGIWIDHGAVFKLRHCVKMKKTTVKLRIQLSVMRCGFHKFACNTYRYLLKVLGATCLVSD